MTSRSAQWADAPSLGGAPAQGHDRGRPLAPDQLSGLDASFVYADNARVFMHTLKLLTLDPTTMAGGYSYQNLVEAIHDAAMRLPNWASKLEFGIPGIEHPHWVSDPDFDVHAHTRRVVISGDSAELDHVIADTMARPLPRNRPLWHATIVEGLLDDRVAVALKIHHSLADGMAFARVLESITSVSPDPLVPAPEPDAAQGRSVRKRELARMAVRTWLHRLLRLPSLVARTLWGAARRLSRRASEHRSLTLLFRGPRLPFNALLSPRRTFARTSISLDQVKQIKSAFGTTVNDVVMAAAAEGLRRWMKRHGIDTTRPVVAGVPVSAETERDRQRQYGNKVSHIPICLHTDLADPIERLEAIHRSSDDAKHDLEMTGQDLLVRWSDLNHPWALRVLWSVVPRLPRPPINLVLASVPGPTQRLHFAGAEVDDLTSVGPILNGIGLNITAWSYCGQLNFGLLACPEHIGDLDQLATDIHDAMTRMSKLAEVRRPGSAEPSPAVLVPAGSAAAS